MRRVDVSHLLPFRSIVIVHTRCLIYDVHNHLLLRLHKGLKVVTDRRKATALDDNECMVAMASTDGSEKNRYVSHAWPAKVCRALTRPLTELVPRTCQMTRRRSPSPKQRQATVSLQDPEHATAWKAGPHLALQISIVAIDRLGAR
jgi:hypothetical protein